MLQLCCTKSVIAQFGIAEDSLCESTAGDGTLGNWYVNLFAVSDIKCVIFMSERTLLSFLIFGLRKDNSTNIAQMFLNGMTQFLESEGFTSDQAEACLGSDRILALTAATNKKAIAAMNAVVRVYEQKIKSQGGFQSCNLSNILSSTNRMPQKTLDWSFPIELARELANEKSA